MMSEPSGLQDTVTAAESNWLKRWAKGPTERASTLLSAGTPAPALTLPDETGTPRRLSEFWTGGPALVMFWRHFGCSCGVARAERLIAECDAYRKANLTPVIIAQGQPNRAARYQAAHAIPCAILSDPDLEAYRAFGVGQWSRCCTTLHPSIGLIPGSSASSFKTGGVARDARPLMIRGGLPPSSLSTMVGGFGSPMNTSTARTIRMLEC